MSDDHVVKQYAILKPFVQRGDSQEETNVFVNVSSFSRLVVFTTV